MGKKPAKTGLKRQHESPLSSKKTWTQKSPLLGYIVADEDGVEHSFALMDEAISFYWS